MAATNSADSAATSASAMERWVEGLPARVRASIAWLPMELRRAVVDPLRDAPSAELEATMDAVVVAAVPIFGKLHDAWADALDSEPGLARELLAGESPGRDRVHAQIRRRLAQRDPMAAVQLHEAYEWLGAIVAALVREIGSMLPAQRVAMPEGADLARELGGPGGALLRAMLWTIASVEAVTDERPLPDGFSRWCTAAWREVQGAANMLRAHGLAVPTAVSVPGVSPRERRRIWSAGSSALLRGLLRPDVLPSGVAELIERAFHPEEVWLFGSRARGDNAPTSDWDLLVVVPDGALPPADDPRAALRRHRVDALVVSRSEFEEGRRAFGSLVDVVLREGFRVDGG